jgi:fructose-1,6-bisphosphatase/inositol monophosphatase family enzyme
VSLDLSTAALEPLMREAGALALRSFQDVTPERKADGTVVSEADRAVEDFLVRALRARFPTHGVLGEEGGLVPGEDPRHLWVLDPIDGTAGFLAELPTWCVSVGLVVDGVPTLGWVYLPVTGELFSGEPGAAWLNGRPLRARALPLDKDTGVLWHARGHRYFETQWPGRIWGLESAAASLVYAARGSLAASLVGMIRPWDLAGAMAILAGAGAALLFLDDGAPVELAPLLPMGRAPRPMIAGHPETLRVVRPQFTAR